MVEQQRAKTPIGVLIIHGFSATHESVAVLLKPLGELGIPVSLPLLAGHGAPSPEALRGLTWEAWMADAEQAFEELLLQVERIIVDGHSMGALLSLYENSPDTAAGTCQRLRRVSMLMNRKMALAMK